MQSTTSSGSMFVPCTWLAGLGVALLLAENGSHDDVEAEVGPGRLRPSPPISPETWVMSQIQFHASLSAVPYVKGAEDGIGHIRRTRNCTVYKSLGLDMGQAEIQT